MERTFHSVYCVCVIRERLSFVCICFFPFGFESGVWDLIVLVPDHCLSLYFSYSLSRLSVIFCTLFVAYIYLLLVFASRFVILHLA